MNDSERMDQKCSESFESYTDFSETPDSTASTQYSQGDYKNVDSVQSFGANWSCSPRPTLDDEFPNMKLLEKDQPAQEPKSTAHDEIMSTSTPSKSSAKQKKSKKSVNKPAVITSFEYILLWD